MTVSDGLVLCERIVAEGSDRYVEGFASFIQGVLRTMAGDWEEGRALIATGRTVLEELGQHVNLASMRMASARPEFFAGRLRESEDDLRFGYDVLDEMGEKGYLSTLAATLAVVLRAQDRHDEAEAYAQEARELGAEDDRSTQLYWRCAQAEVLASRGEIDEARRLVQEAQEVIDATDMTIDRAAALLSRAFVEKAAGNRDRARIALEQALGLFEEKGDVTAAAHTHGLLGAV